MTHSTLAFEHTFAAAMQGLYQPVEPKGFPAPTLLERNRALETALGFPALSDEELAALASGTSLPASARPIAQAYAGHQFGHLSPQLGDGRALLLGELLDDEGRRFDLHLKGVGRTPYSRGGDGRATLGPALRELLVSEAMANLGVSTSRVLAVVTTGETVHRETPLPGAVLARVAASHLRVGSFELLALRREVDQIEALARYALGRHYPERADEPAASTLLREVTRAQAELVASWMHVGFIHGVMNTDNVTLSGETLDYGPCAFLDVYDPDTVFSSIDRDGRYAFGNQPSIALWNMLRLAEALLPLLAVDQPSADAVAADVTDVFRETFNHTYVTGMRRKTGLVGEADDDVELLGDLLDWMANTGQDYTRTFRRLAQALRLGEVLEAEDAVFAGWWRRWQARLGDEPRAAVAARMDAVNPIYIPRNHLVEEALARAHDGDMAPFRTLTGVLEDPWVERAGLERYAAPAPEGFGPYRTFCGT